MKVEHRLELVRKLAEYEAPWIPISQESEWAQGASVYAARQRQANYARRPAGDVRQRKASERERDALEAAGLMRGRLLTPEGRRVARGFSWPCLPHLHRVAINRMRRLAKSRHCLVGGWIPENAIAGEGWGDGAWSALRTLQDLLLPALAERVVEWGSLATGHVFYRLLTTKRIDPRKFIGQADKLDESLSEAYDLRRKECWAAILADRTYRPQIGLLPLVPENLRNGRGFDQLPRWCSPFLTEWLEGED